MIQEDEGEEGSDDDVSKYSSTMKKMRGMRERGRKEREIWTFCLEFKKSRLDMRNLKKKKF